MRIQNAQHFNFEQRKESAKLLLGITQVILLAVVAGPFIPAIAKKLTFWDNMYGLFYSVIFYGIAMILLKKKK